MTFFNINVNYYCYLLVCLFAKKFQGNKIIGISLLHYKLFEGKRVSLISGVPEASSKDTSNYSNTSLETASGNNPNPPLDVTVEPLLHEAGKAVGMVVVELVVVVGGGSTSEVRGRGHRGGGKLNIIYKLLGLELASSRKSKYILPWVLILIN